MPLLLILGAAFFVRLGVSSDLGSTPLFRTPQLDSREYFTWAEQIAAGNFAWPVPPAHGPGYSFFLGALLAIFDGSLAVVRLVQAALGAVTCLLAARLSTRLFGRTAGLVTGFALALYGPLALTDVSVLSEGLLLFLLCAAFLVLSGRQESRARLAAGGVLFGLAAIVRPTCLLFLPPILVWIAWRGGWRARALGGAAILAAACAIPILPVAVANVRSTPGPVLIQGHGGLNFYIGNSPRLGGVPSVRPGEAWDRLEAEPARHGVTRPAGQDRYFYAKTFREIGDAPLAWVRLLGAKAVWAVQADEIRDTFSYGFFRNESSILRLLPGFGLLFPLAAAGIAVAARSRPRPVLLWIWLVTALTTCVLLVVASRYRLPAVPALAILAGAGIAGLIGRPSGSWRLRAPALAALCAGAVICQLRVHEPSHQFSEEWSASGTALNHEKELPAAVRDFDRALALNERYAPARVGRGAVLLNLGRMDEAERELRRAVELEPQSRVALTELGIALDRLNRPGEAEAWYRAAIALDPEDPATRRTLGGNLLRQGRAAESEAVLRDVVRRAPADAGTRLALARALGAQRRTAEALVEVREATRLDPSSGDAWLTMAMLAVDAGQLPEAETALEGAERAGAPGRDTSMGRALLYRAERLPDRVDRELRPLVRSDPGFRPAVELFLQNARERGAEREAIDFLRQNSHQPS
ncbi:MAG: tetratricopeptide repeat protein [Acidobacteriota bacterium]